MFLSTYASGYKRNYPNDEEEVKALLGENKRNGMTGDPTHPEFAWWPTTPDFTEQATREARKGGRKDGRVAGVASFNALLATIRATKDLEAVVWFGHGSPKGELQFGNGQNFGLGQLSGLHNADVSKSFRKGGYLTLYACNAGQSPEFLQGIANAVRVTVFGFTTGVRWGLEYDGVSPKRHITYRGLLKGWTPSPKQFEPK